MLSLFIFNNMYIVAECLNLTIVTILNNLNLNLTHIKMLQIIVKIIILHTNRISTIKFVDFYFCLLSYTCL